MSIKIPLLLTLFATLTPTSAAPPDLCDLVYTDTGRPILCEPHPDGALLEQFRQSVLAAAFRGDLTAQWREQNPDVEPASVLLERIRVERKARFIEDAAEKARAKAEAKALAAGKPWTRADDLAVLETGRAKAEKKYVEPEPVDATGLPELPEGWCWARIEELVWEGPTNGYSGQTDNASLGTLTMKLSATSSGQLILNTATTKRLVEIISADSRHWLAEGDVLVQRANSLEYLGATVVFEGHPEPIIYPDLMMRLRPTQRFIGALLRRYLNSRAGRDQLRSRATGTAGSMPKINGEVLRSTYLPVAPEAELLYLLPQLDTMLASGDLLREVANTILEQRELLNQSILAKAFRGELVPQDPTDEPASVLLDRIRAERAATPKRSKKSPRPTTTATAAPADPPPRTPQAKRRPPETPKPPATPTETVDETEQTMVLIRAALRGRGSVPREEVVHAIAEGLGYQRVSANVRERVDGHLLAAVRRYVIEGGGGEELRLATARLDDYDRDSLVATLGSVGRRGCVYTRDELARMVLDHLGFRRLTSSATKAIKSAINAAIRRGLFERVDAKQLRRCK